MGTTASVCLDRQRVVPYIGNFAAWGRPLKPAGSAMPLSHSFALRLPDCRFKSAA
jgi:hypothetical protein